MEVDRPNLLWHFFRCIFLTYSDDNFISCVHFYQQRQQEQAISWTFVYL